MTEDVTDLLNVSVRELLDRVAAREPTPGGGSVAAFVGALAASTAQMVARYTIGNKRYAQHEKQVQQWLDELERTRRAFESLMAEDIAAYSRYDEARRGGDATARQQALATATAVPLEMIALASQAAAGMDAIKERCNSYLLSDLVVAVVLCEATGQAAASSVRVNLRAFDNADEANRISAELDRMLTHLFERRAAVTAYVTKT